MRKVGYPISIVGLLLVFTVKIGQALRGAVRRRRVQRIWAHKRDEWLQQSPRFLPTDRPLVRTSDTRYPWACEETSPPATLAVP